MQIRFTEGTMSCTRIPSFQDDRGRVWVSTLQVAYFENGRFTSISAVPGGVIHSIAGDHSGSLWIGYQNHDLFPMLGKSIVEQDPRASLRRKDFAYALATDPEGGVWLGFMRVG